MCEKLDIPILQVLQILLALSLERGLLILEGDHDLPAKLPVFALDEIERNYVFAERVEEDLYLGFSDLKWEALPDQSGFYRMLALLLLRAQPGGSPSSSSGFERWWRRSPVLRVQCRGSKVLHEVAGVRIKKPVKLFETAVEELEIPSSKPAVSQGHRFARRFFGFEYDVAFTTRLIKIVGSVNPVLNHVVPGEKRKYISDCRVEGKASHADNPVKAADIGPTRFLKVYIIELAGEPCRPELLLAGLEYFYISFADIFPI